MAQSLSKILLHTVFSTKHREPRIPPDLQAELHAYMAGILRDCGCPVLEINTMPDHAHILHVLSRTQTVGEVLRRVKEGSSKWLRSHAGALSDFHWQNGYGTFSIGQTQVEALRTYIRNQQEHHRTRTFQDEFRAWMEKYEVEFDEAYVWD